jgi:sigma-B regulation protein RsbU (phosphoserine phosphatase)
MNDVKPVLTTQPKTKRRSIKTKFLLALLVLSLLPLILFVAITRFVLLDVREDIKAALIQRAHADIGRLTKSQASIASAMLDKVEAETQMVAFFAQALLRDPAAFGHTRSYSRFEKPKDIATASEYDLTPGLARAAAQPELDLTSNLDPLFALVAKGDPNLETIYIGMQSGVFRVHPWGDDKMEKFEFTLNPALMQPSNEGENFPTPLRQAFEQNGVALSPHAMLTTIDPRDHWVVSDDENEKVFALRRVRSGIAAYSIHDPKTRSWYRNAIGRDSVVWTKYPNLGRGVYLFSLGNELKGQIGEKVSPSLTQEFARHRITLVANSPISIDKGGSWSLQDRGGNNYQIIEINGQLNVYNQDMVTCSRAVLDPEGRLAGVVGLDLNVETIRRRIIHPPVEEVEGYAFLLNPSGELVDQEKPDMFIPAAGSPIRSKMIAGDLGHDYDAATATDLFYAPIYSADNKSFWSLGFSMPEAEITRIFEPIRKRMLSLVAFLLGIGASMVILVVGVANRMSNGITGPILQLGTGVKRIGAGNLDCRVKVETHDEIEELADAFNKMAGDLKTYIKDLKRTTAEKERFESELRVAHDIQMSFLKKIFPPFPNRDDFSLYAAIKPAREVGGDLYDFALLDDSRIFFYIGDVSDKGVPASLIMAMTMTLMKRASLQPGITPAGILHQVNVTLAEGNENVMFVTLFIGILNVTTGELAFSNAGHNPPVILSAHGECSFLKLPDGLVLGVMPETQYCDATVVLERGDAIVTYTDGVTEAMNPEGELYSERRLQETVAGLSDRSVEDAVAAIFGSVKAHAAGAPQSDDIAVLAVRRN